MTAREAIDKALLNADLGLCVEMGYCGGPADAVLDGLRAKGFVVLPVADAELAVRYMRVVAKGLTGYGKDMTDWEPVMARIEEAIRGS